jgi:hypothetical protein
MAKAATIRSETDTGQIEQPEMVCGPRAEILEQLRSPDAQERARAVRELCPCRTTWETPFDRYILPMLSDPDVRVRQAAEHVLTEDTPEDPFGRGSVRNKPAEKADRGTKLSGWRSKAGPIVPENDEGSEDGVGAPLAAPSAPGLGWRRRPRPRTKGAAARLAWSPRPRR